MDRADDLDHLDLLTARSREDDVERGLLLGCGAVTVPPPPGRGSGHQVRPR